MSAGEIELLPGERVLWAGEPVQRPLYVAADGVIAPAGLILAVAALWFLLAKQPSGGAMAGADVVLVIGLYGAVGRSAVRYLALGRTTYAETDSRIIARSGLFRQKERASELAGPSAPGSPWPSTKPRPTRRHQKQTQRPPEDTLAVRSYVLRACGKQRCGRASRRSGGCSTATTFVLPMMEFGPH